MLVLAQIGARFTEYFAANEESTAEAVLDRFRTEFMDVDLGE
jgi:hypothetical protein